MFRIIWACTDNQHFSSILLIVYHQAALSLPVAQPHMQHHTLALLFLPRNDAFAKLLPTIGLPTDFVSPLGGLPAFSLASVAGLFGEASGFMGSPIIEGIRELVDAILFFHFVPAGPNQTHPYGWVSAPPHMWNGTEFNTL